MFSQKDNKKNKIFIPGKYLARLMSMVMVLSLMFVLNACSGSASKDSVTIPDVTGSEESVAKNILSSQGLLPDVQYAYSDTVAEGNVIETVPAVGSAVAKGDAVAVYVSKGPSIVKPKDGRFYFDDVHKDSQDNMKASVRKENGILYLECDVTFLSVGREYVVPEVGYASTDADFMFSIPIKITDISHSYDGLLAYNKFTIEIPLDELGDHNPSRVYLNLDRIEYPNGPDSYKQVYKKRAWFAFDWE